MNKVVKSRHCRELAALRPPNEMKPCGNLERNNSLLDCFLTALVSRTLQLMRGDRGKCLKSSKTACRGHRGSRCDLFGLPLYPSRSRDSEGAV
jgi:hypothetical protein